MGSQNKNKNKKQNKKQLKEKKKEKDTTSMAMVSSSTTTSTSTPGGGGGGTKKSKPAPRKSMSQNRLIFEYLMRFYRTNDHFHRMYSSRAEEEGRISLRILDWFSTNYSKKYYTVYTKSNGERFKVHKEYKEYLNSYNKQRFDPFCRWDNLTLSVQLDATGKATLLEAHPPGDDTMPPPEGCTVVPFETTLGQLNFYRWAMNHEVIEYVENHYEEIKDDMMKRSKGKNSPASSLASNESIESNLTTSSSTSSNKTRKKREELSISAAKSIKRENVDIVLRIGKHS